MSLEISKIVKYKNVLIATNNSKTVGAEPGSMFFVLESESDAETLLKELNRKIYDSREMRAVCVPVETFTKCIQPHLFVQ